MLLGTKGALEKELAYMQLGESIGTWAMILAGVSSLFALLTMFWSNTFSLTYKGIRMTYGMSIDYLGDAGIAKQYIQRGASLITRKPDGAVDISMVPLTSVVSTRVRGQG